LKAPIVKHKTIAKRLDKVGSNRIAGPAGYGMGVAWAGGPLYADAFGAKRGPSPYQLIEAYKQINFACTEFNALGVSCLNLHLMAASGPGMEKPRSMSEPMPIAYREKKRIMSLPYVRRAFNVGGVEDVQEITQSVFLDALERPAIDPMTGLSYFDRQTLIATLCRYIDTVGLAYLKPEDEFGDSLQSLASAGIPPSHWWPLQSQYVWPIRETNCALIKEFRYFTDYYPPGDLVYIRLRPSLRDPYGSGYAAAQAAWQYAGLEDKGISMWDQLLGTGARPNLLVSAKDPDKAAGEDERRRMAAELNTFHAGGRGGRAIVTNGAYDFTPLMYQGFDTGEMEVNNYNMERMYNCYGVPVAYASRESNLANLQAADKFHAKYGINPRAWCIASALTDLVKRYDSRLFWVFDNPIAEDELQEATIVDMQVKSGLISRNQATQDSPWPPDEMGDLRFMPNTMATPDMLVQAHEQQMATQQQANEAAKSSQEMNEADFWDNDDGEQQAPERGVEMRAFMNRFNTMLDQAEAMLK
jgi:Phage portal protein